MLKLSYCSKIWLKPRQQCHSNFGLTGHLLNPSLGFSPVLHWTVTQKHAWQLSDAASFHVCSSSLSPILDIYIFKFWLSPWSCEIMNLHVRWCVPSWVMQNCTEIKTIKTESKKNDKFGNYKRCHMGMCYFWWHIHSITKLARPSFWWNLLCDINE